MTGPGYVLNPMRVALDNGR